jgi:hypothetical protein
MSTLKIESKKELMNILRSYKIYVDGKSVGRVQNGKIQYLELESGNHNVYVKMDWFKSNKIDIEINDSKDSSIEIKGSDLYLGITIFYAIIFLFLITTRLIFNIDFDTKFPLFIFLFLIITKDATLKIKEIKTN